MLKIMDDVSDKLKSYETDVRHRIHCQERAFRIVNKLIDDAVQESYLIECGQLIGQEHYSDIVEERAISLLCGYPLCRNTLANIPKKKYHISTKSNRVYDISDRKNFCSNQCYCASKHFQKQISESPIWARGKLPPVKFNFLDKGCNKGSVGDEIIGWNPRKALEEEVAILGDASSTETSHRNVPEKKSVKCKDFKTSKRDTKIQNCDDIQQNGNYSNETSEIVKNQPLSIDTPSDPIILHDVCEQLERNVHITNINSNISNEHCQPHDPQLNKDLPKIDLISSVKKGEQASKKNDPSNPHILVKHSYDVSCSENEEKEIKLSTSKKNVSADKIQHLKELMAKKKTVLSKMAEVQTISLDKKAPVKSQNESLLQKPKTQALDSNLKPKITKSSIISPLSIIGETLKRWICPKTVQFLHTSEILSDSGEMARFSDPKIQMGYANLCKRLDAREIEMDKLVKETVDGGGDEEGEGMKSSSENQKKLPDYKALKEEAEAFQLKVTEFVTGKRPKDQIKVKNTKDPEVFLPTVDAYDQQKIRIRIVLDKLDKSLSGLLGSLGLSVQDVSDCLRELVYTFNLEKDTIVFKPWEWTLVSLCVLKMLAIKHHSIQEAFERESSKRFFGTMLQGIDHSIADLDNFVKELIS